MIPSASQLDQTKTSGPDHKCAENEGSTQSARVTVVMPCFNAAATIAESIRSVQAQTLNDWELLVIDDGSQDRSRVIVQALADADPRIRLIEQANAGPAVARNRGVRLSDTDIVAFLDSDDIWQPKHLAHAIGLLDAEPELGIAFAPCEHMTADGKLTGQFTRAWVGGVALSDVLSCNPTATCSSLVVRRAVFATAGEMRADMVHAEDQEWLFRVAHAGWQLRSHAAATVGYRASPNGLSSDVARMYEGWRAVIDHARALEPDVVARALPQATAAMHLYYARRLMRDGTFGARAIGHALTAISASPRTILRCPIAAIGALGLAMVGALSPSLATYLFSTWGSVRHA